MYRLHRASLVWHAVVWIVLYVATMGVGAAVSEAVGIAHVVTAPAVLILCALALVHLRRHGWLAFYGVAPVVGSRRRPAVYFVPLAAMAVVQFFKGPDPTLGLRDVVLVALLMIGVGFIEELVFRGFLYRAIRERGGVVRAVLISGLSFGIGHVLNLLNGFTGIQQILQIVLAFAIGVALALLFELTGSLLPGALFHVVLNISGSVSIEGGRPELYAAAVVMVIAVGFAAWLWSRVRVDGGVLTPLPTPA